MKKLLLLGLLLLLGFNQAFASPKRIEIHELTIGGNSIANTVIATSQTVTSDSVYMRGNSGYNSLVTTVTGGVAINYQVSADNSTWYTPNISNAPGNPSSVGTIDGLLSSNMWISFPWTISPYIRFNYKSTNQSTIDSMIIWQDES